MTDRDPVLDLGILNLALLLKLQLDVTADPLAACYRYGIPLEWIPRIQGLSLQTISALAANLDRAVFSLRGELLEFSDHPEALMGILAVVRHETAPDECNAGPPAGA